MMGCGGVERHLPFISYWDGTWIGSKAEDMRVSILKSDVIIPKTLGYTSPEPAPRWHFTWQ